MASDESGIHLIKRAIELDTNKRYADALVCYREGIELLMDSIKNVKDERKRKAFREKICTYIDRAEKLKQLVEEIKESGKYHEQINIAEHATGFSYQKVFSRFFDDEVLDFVEINDPYIHHFHQLNNLLRFCEMMIKSSRKIKKVVLETTKNENANNNQQEARFEEIKEVLGKRDISFIVKYNSALHDREITLSNGWIIKIGRGLDYFQRPEQGGKFCIGLHDFDLRPCLATTIDVFHKSSTKVTN